MLDTKNDQNRRQILAMCAYNKLRYILESKKNTIKTKVKVFNAFVRNIFMYNSELWPLTKNTGYLPKITTMEDNKCKMAKKDLK